MTAQRSPRLQRFAALALCALGIASASWAQSGNVAINNNGAAAAPTAILDVSSITQGLFVPRMAALPALTVPQGLTVFRTGAANVRGFYVLDYGQWMPLLNSNKNAWDLYGNHLNSLPNPNQDYLGTSDNLPMYFRTNNLHRMRLDATTGNLGVGFAAAAAAAPERLDINGALRMYYVSNPGVQTSNTDAEGVMRYQTYGTVTGSGGGQHGTNEVVALAAVVAPQPAYPIIQAGHWGNVNGTAYTIGTTTPSVTQPDIKGWRLFENVYEEGFSRAYTHFKEAKCAAGTADIPSGPASVYSNSGSVPALDQELSTPFLAYGSQIYMRRQYLFLPREMNMELAQVGGVAAVQGLCPGQPVTSIGFYVWANQTRGPSAGQMDVSVRNAPAGLNALNGFDNSAYYGTKSCGSVAAGATWPSSTIAHWETVTISPAFVWDGTSNVIIEVAMKYAVGTVFAGNGPVLVTNTGFNATYGANTTAPPAVATLAPDLSPNAASCNTTSNVQTRMPDTGTGLYHYGASQWRPVVRFGGTVASVDAAAPTAGSSNYITYPGAFIVEDTLGASVNRPWGLWRPSYPAGNVYWANQGNGTISAQRGVYDNGSRLNDFVFDRAFDGKVAPKDAAQFGDRPQLTMDEMAEFTKEHRHLPTMKGRNAWEQENGFSLGDLTNQLWATTETQTLYVTELHDKLNVIEMLTNERPITAAELQMAMKELSAMADLSDGDKARLIADLRKRATLTSTSR